MANKLENAARHTSVERSHGIIIPNLQHLDPEKEKVIAKIRNIPLPFDQTGKDVLCSCEAVLNSRCFFKAESSKYISMNNLSNKLDELRVALLQYKNSGLKELADAKIKEVENELEKLRKAIGLVI